MGHEVNLRVVEMINGVQKKEKGSATQIFIHFVD